MQLTQKRFSADRDPGRSSPFANTHWSVVRRAGIPDGLAQNLALEDLCRVYWPPLYAFIRRRGYSVEDAQDLTQGFFARLLEGSSLGTVDPRKGKFRSFLLAALENFLANQWRHGRTQKRGGDLTFISFDAELENGIDPASAAIDPDRYFNRQWALALLGQVLARLEAEFAETGKTALHEELKGVLNGDDKQISYAQIAARHGMTEAAVKMTAFRLRKRYGELLRAELERTLSDPTEVQDELRALFAAMN